MIYYQKEYLNKTERKIKMTNKKINSVFLLPDGRYELKTINSETNSETILIVPEKTVIEQYESLKNSKKKIEDTISKLNKEIKDYEQIELEFGGKYTDEDVQRFNEIAQLADSRNNVDNRKNQIDAAREMIVETHERMRLIEVNIPKLLRN